MGLRGGTDHGVGVLLPNALGRMHGLLSPSIQRLNRVSEKATNEIVAFLAEPPRIALEPDQVAIPTFPFGQMVVSAPAGWHIAGASQTNSALTTK